MNNWNYEGFRSLVMEINIICHVLASFIGDTYVVLMLLAGWTGLAGWLAGWLGWLAGWMVRWLAGLTGRLDGWIIGYVIESP